MIRAFLASGRAFLARGPRVALPFAAIALLAGCVTSGYSYREDRGGGYYYGSPSVEYRDLTPYPYGPYGPYGGYYGPYRYAYPTPYGYRFYGYYGHGPYGGYPYSPYYGGYPYRYRHVEPRAPRPDSTPDRPRSPRPDSTPDRPRSPWRDLDHLRRRGEDPMPGVATPAVPPPSAPPRATIAPRPEGGFGGRIRRAKERASGSEGTL